MQPGLKINTVRNDCARRTFAERRFELGAVFAFSIIALCYEQHIIDFHAISKALLFKFAIVLHFFAINAILY